MSPYSVGEDVEGLFENGKYIYIYIYIQVYIYMYKYIIYICTYI
jgi:hypothetical protein